MANTLQDLQHPAFHEYMELLRNLKKRYQILLVQGKDNVKQEIVAK